MSPHNHVVMPGRPAIHVLEAFSLSHVDARRQVPGMTELPRLRTREYATQLSNMITLRSVLPAFMLAKPSLISESFSFAEIQSSRCSLPRM